MILFIDKFCDTWQDKFTVEEKISYFIWRSTVTYFLNDCKEFVLASITEPIYLQNYV